MLKSPRASGEVAPKPSDSETGVSMTLASGPVSTFSRSSV